MTDTLDFEVSFFLFFPSKKIIFTNENIKHKIESKYIFKCKTNIKMWGKCVPQLSKSTYLTFFSYI